MTIRIFLFVIGLMGLAAATGLVLETDSSAQDAHLSYFGNGQAKEQTLFIEGLRHGPTTRWDSDGTLRAQGRYEMGKMVGEWVWNTPEGLPDPSRSGTYESGRRISF